MRRGEVWWVDLDPTRGSEIRKRRPGVIVSVDALNKARRTVVVVPLSTSAAPRPPIVVSVTTAAAGSVAVCDQVRAVDKSRLVERLGALATDDMKTLSECLSVVLGL
ncbi:MAG: type II toxin-antitoxin system PemK/MazF family toxin [Solidesulfovibrio sp.]|jgi:mRNA interferase MazF|uniref:type II toxin-antitoxin system PemK/MazF family toxin n=1 Tax=Solidesulfovibrio sp. TaxID=2910990 RepID=UPI002B2084F8|nr:type II toxin-antitoxin system PemK/MazF family toxin [Solidesulfovibrio sp.]MEA4855178.1 type II toxin-antitoxin system PemK/MazF family toxin [Solidesulfovibrio sp.]